MAGDSTINHPGSNGEAEKENETGVEKDEKPVAAVKEPEKETIKEPAAIEQEPKKTDSIKSEKRIPKWQDRLLPVMSGVLIGLTIFFFLATFVQMSYLHRTILQMPVINISDESGERIVDNAETFQEQFEARQFEVRSKMEAFIVSNRYHQANVLLMAGLWIRYLGFITGMILALVGASFVLGKLREPSQKLEGKFSAIQVNLATTSPGIILVLLGVVLMFATLIDRDYYTVRDMDIYLRDTNLVTESSVEPISTFIPPSLFQITPTLSIESTPNLEGP